MPSPCAELGDRAHLVLHVLSTRSRRSKKSMCVYDVQDLSREIGVEDPKPVQVSLEELAETGVLNIVDAESRTVKVVAPCTCDDKVFSCDSYGVFSFSLEESTDSSIPRYRSTAHMTGNSRGVEMNAAGVSSLSSSRQAKRSTKGWDGGAHPLPLAARKARRADVSTWKASTLAQYFAEQGRDLAGEHRSGGKLQIDFKIFGGHLRRWVQQGASPADVKAMIDCFYRDLPRYVYKGRPLWMCFVGKRTQLWDDTEQSRKVEWNEDRRTVSLENREAWVASDLPTAGKDDRSYWLGSQR